MMAVGFAFIVTEYCTQSHLSTECYADAAQGLRRTRWFKKHTYFFRGIEYVIEFGKLLCLKIFGRHVHRGRRSLVWTWKNRYSAIPTIVIEESRLRGVEEGRSEDSSGAGEGRSEDVSYDGETDGGETGGETDGETDASADVALQSEADGGETDVETDASADVPLQKLLPAPIQHIETRR